MCRYRDLRCGCQGAGSAGPVDRLRRDDPTAVEAAIGVLLDRLGGDASTGTSGRTTRAVGAHEATRKKDRYGMTASRYTPEIADDILTRISEGTPLRQAARDIGMPESTIREWVRGDVEGFAAKYKEARALQIDAWADEVLVVAYRRGSRARR